MRLSSTVRVHCEGTVENSRGVRTPCPVRFEWVGPAREDPFHDDEMRDARSALDAAEDLGWSFDEAATHCPRHRGLALEAPDLKESARG